MTEHMGMRRKKIMAGAAMYALLGLLDSLVLIPVLWMVSTAFKSYGETIAKPPRWVPQQISFEAFGRLWSEYPFGTYFKNSFVIVLFSMAVSVFASCLAGYGLTRFKFRGRNSLMTFILVTQMFPSVMLLVPFYSIIGKMHLLDTHLGLILVYISFTVPFCTWTMLGFFRALPLDLDEAARIDGCNSWQCFSRIILPLTLPGIIAGSMLVFLPSLGAFYIPEILGGAKSMLIGNFIKNQFMVARDWPLGAAASTILTLLLALLIAVYRMANRKVASRDRMDEVA